jgi:glutathione S-transferase
MSDRNKFRLYYMDISYFSGKMQAYLRYKQIPHELIHIDWAMMTNVILPNTGMMQVPVVETPDGQWLRDTTPMIDWFEARYPAGPVLPADEYQAFFCRLLEDYADEWMWRPALHYRWSFKKDRELYGRRFLEDFIFHPPGTRWLTKRFLIYRQRKTYIKGDGVRRDTREHVEGQYRETLRQLEAILSESKFLFGDRPCLADFGFFASMFRHFSIDPTPGRIMREEAPAVYAWVARMWDATHSTVDPAGDRKLQTKISKKLPGKRDSIKWSAKSGRLPPGWIPILRSMGATYLPYLSAMARAADAGRKKFNVTIENTKYRKLPVVPYRLWCRKRLQDHFEGLSEGARRRVTTTLREAGCDQLWDGGSGLQSAEFDPLPLCAPRPVGAFSRLYRYFEGTAWHRGIGRE